MFHTFFNGLDELYQHAKFGEIEQRAPAIDAKIWCLYVLIFCHATRPARCSIEGCIICTNNVLPFIGRFRRGFHIFLSEGMVLFRCYVEPQASRNCGPKFRKVQKSPEVQIRGPRSLFTIKRRNNTYDVTHFT